jgi:hypothetical protein
VEFRILGPLEVRAAGRAVSRLRKALGDGAPLVTTAAGYLVEEPDWKPGVLGGTKGKFPMASLVRYAQGGEPF